MTFSLKAVSPLFLMSGKRYVGHSESRASEAEQNPSQ